MGLGRNGVPPLVQLEAIKLIFDLVDDDDVRTGVKRGVLDRGPLKLVTASGHLGARVFAAAKTPPLPEVT
jgi:hypothetical protein